jgi:hypothetical protein
LLIPAGRHTSGNSAPAGRLTSIRKMTLTGNIQEITNKRDSRHQDITLQVDKVEYITSRKDGNFFQDFDYEDVLDTPLLLTGDCLARSDKKYAEPGEIVFQVYDKVGEDYVLNEQKDLVVTMEYIEEDDLTILTSVSYSVRVSNDEFQQIKRDRNKDKMTKLRKNKKRR